MAKVYIYNLEVPFFPGYYDSIFDPGDAKYNELENDEEEIQYQIKKYGIDFSIDDIDIDMEYYKKDIGYIYCKQLSEHLPPWIISCKYEHTWSPKEYNFATDEMYSDCEFKENYRELIMEFINKHYDKLKDKIYNRWTSYDGFWSHTDNNIDNWITDIKESESCDEVYLWYLWECWLEFEYFPKYDVGTTHDPKLKDYVWDFIWFPVWEHIYIGEYFVYNKKSYVDREEQTKENKELLLTLSL